MSSSNSLRTLGKNRHVLTIIIICHLLLTITIICHLDLRLTHSLIGQFLPPTFDQAILSSRKLKDVIVYIAGRNPDGGGDRSIIDQLHISVLSACRTTMQENKTALSFAFFISVLDHMKCTHSSNHSDACDYYRVEQSCHRLLPEAKFHYFALDEKILNMWKEHSGIVSFAHHSTWYGYAKLWLPNLLHVNFSSILFVDTDTIWNKPPSVLFNELSHFNATQVIACLSINPSAGPEILWM
eukprot:CCRYP_013355-RA/>CCRYP_013355-RA protein AED:0.09 eAED:0.09 QI:123/1/1/1/0/0/2/514/239